MKWIYRNDTGKDVSHNSKRWVPGEVDSVPFSVPDEKGLTLLKFETEVRDRFAGGPLKLSAGEKKMIYIPECNTFMLSILCFSGGVNIRYNGDADMPPAHLRPYVKLSGQYERDNVSSVELHADTSGADLEILIERVI